MPSPDQIIRAAERYFQMGLPIPPSIVEMVQQQYPCPECVKARAESPERRYWQDVRNAAEYMQEMVIDQEVESSEELNDALWQYIDSHQRVIYTARAMEAVQFSPNDSYSIDNFGVEGMVSDSGIDWSRLAFGAFYADVMEDTASPNWTEPFRCNDCETYYEMSDSAVECCSEDFECDACGEEYSTEKEAEDCPCGKNLRRLI